jgi:uncharacterized membrane protein
MQTLKQPKTRAESVNFFVSLLTIIFTFIAAQGVEIPIDAPAKIVDAIGTMNAITIMLGLTPNLIVPIIKVIANVKAMGWDWSFLKSTNFTYQIVSALMLLLELLGILPVDAGKVAAGLLQSINIAQHVTADRLKAESVI